MQLYPVIPQDLRQSASPTFDDLTLSNPSNIYDLSHDSFAVGTIASHDTNATGSELDTLTDNSIANTLHRHSELVASDGSPDPALSVDSDGHITGVGKATFQNLLLGDAVETDSDILGYLLLFSEGNEEVRWQNETHSNTDTDALNIFSRRSRGTRGSESAVVLNDRIFSFIGQGYDGSNYQSAGAFTLKVDGAVSSGVVPMRLAYETGTAFGDRAERVIIKSDGKIGFNEPAPETLTEWTHTEPYLTLHNSTHEDTDGGRESRLIFKGEQSGGEETSLAMLEVCHDGTSDDQLGKYAISVNTGSGVAEAMCLDSNLAAFFTKIKLTAIGGYAVKLTNKTGANTVAGQTVKADTATDDAVILTAADDDECIGVFLDSGIADAAEAWVVVTGIADVAMEDNTAATHGNWVQTSETEAGYADSTDASPQAAPQHFNEIGHCIESVAAGGGGTHILARCILHFN